MTGKDLEKYWYITRELDLLSGRRARPIPESRGAGQDDDTGRERREKERIQELLDDKRAIESFVEKVGNSRMRQILTLRYLEGYKWKEVAAHFGHRESEDSVKKAAQRFLVSRQGPLSGAGKKAG